MDANDSSAIRHTIVKNTLWLAGGTLVSRIFRAAVMLYAARALGTAGYGIFAYALSVAAFFTTFSDIGLSGLLMRELGEKDPERRREIFSTALVLKAGIVSLAAAAAIWGTPLFTKIAEAKSLIPLIAAILIFDSLQVFGFSILKAQGRMPTEAKITVFSNFCIAALGITALAIRPDARPLAASYAVGTGIGMALAGFAIREYFRNALRYFRTPLIRPLLRNALPLATLGLMGMLMTNIDTILIGWFRNAHELGLYGAVVRLIQLLYMVPTFLTYSAFPIINRLIREGDNEKVRVINERASRALLAISLPLLAGGVAVTQPLVSWLFGNAYLGAAPTLALLLVTLPIVFTGHVTGNAALAYGEQRIFVPATIMGLIANIGLDIALIPQYGIVGSAIATIVALALANGYIWYRLNRKHPLSILRHTERIFAASIAIGALAFFLRELNIHVTAIVAVSAVAYAGLLWLFREPLLREIKDIFYGIAIAGRPNVSE
jgi:O-antigen/teichoic acid export membrane protein